MKKRKGFVSNSSTSSFVIHGTCIEDGEYDDCEGDEEGGKNPIVWLKEIRDRDPELYIKHVNINIAKSEATIAERGGSDDYHQNKLDVFELMLKLNTLTEEEALLIKGMVEEELLYCVCDELFDMSVHIAPWGESFVGLDWSSVGDEETGKQFKERATKMVELLFGKCEISTMKHAWRDG